MNYNTTIEYLGKELGVKESQVKNSLSRTKALKKIDTEKANFTLDELIADDEIGIQERNESDSESYDSFFDYSDAATQLDNYEQADIHSRLNKIRTMDDYDRNQKNSYLDFTIGQVSGIVPIKAYLINAKDAKNEESVIIYSHKAIVNETEKTMIKTSTVQEGKKYWDLGLASKFCSIPRKIKCQYDGN